MYPATMEFRAKAAQKKRLFSPTTCCPNVLNPSIVIKHRPSIIVENLLAFLKLFPPLFDAIVQFLSNIHICFKIPCNLV